MKTYANVAERTKQAPKHCSVVLFQPVKQRQTGPMRPGKTAKDKRKRKGG